MLLLPPLPPLLLLLLQLLTHGQSVSLYVLCLALAFISFHPSTTFTDPSSIRFSQYSAILSITPRPYPLRSLFSLPVSLFCVPRTSYSPQPFASLRPPSLDPATFS
jgi:hypothetical protein